MSLEQIRKIIERDGLAHVARVSKWTGIRSEEVYVTEVTDPKIVDGEVVPGRVIGFVFDGHRKDFKRPINAKHDGKVFHIGGDCGKRKYKFSDVDEIHIEYLYDVVGEGGVKIEDNQSGCTSTHTFYGVDLNIAQAWLLCQQVRKSGLDSRAWTPAVGDYARASGKGRAWKPDWKQMDKVFYNLQKLVD